jgi:ankyrin repeat protein
MEASAFGHDDVVSLLIASGADVNLKNSAGENALQKATRSGHEKIIELLKQAGAEEGDAGGKKK